MENIIKRIRYILNEDEQEQEEMKTAETEADMVDPNAESDEILYTDEQPQEEQPVEEVPPLDGNIEYQEEPEVQSDIIDMSFKKVKLYDLCIALINYMEFFKNNCFDKIQIDQVEDHKLKRTNKEYEALLQLIKDFTFYMEHSFDDEEYVKNIYMYELINKRFSLIIKNFRAIYKLDSLELEKTN